jgi:hypothetical protein
MKHGLLFPDTCMTTKYLHIRQISLWLVFMLLAASCSRQNSCLEPQTVVMRGAFFSRDSSNTAIDSIQTNANIYFGDSLRYVTQIKNISRFSVPLSPLADSVTLIFQSDSTLLDPSTIDTISLSYTRELKFMSVACGYQMNYLLQSANTTHQVIDSVFINTADVTNDINKQHLRIFLKK